MDCGTVGRSLKACFNVICDKQRYDVKQLLLSLRSLTIALKVESLCSRQPRLLHTFRIRAFRGMCWKDFPGLQATNGPKLNRSRQSLNMTATAAVLKKTSPFELWHAHAPAFTLRLFLSPGLFHIKREGSLILKRAQGFFFVLSGTHQRIR